MDPRAPASPYQEVNDREETLESICEVTPYFLEKTFRYDNWRVFNFQDMKLSMDHLEKLFKTQDFVMNCVAIFSCVFFVFVWCSGCWINLSYRPDWSSREFVKLSNRWIWSSLMLFSKFNCFYTSLHSDVDVKYCICITELFSILNFFQT